MELQFADHEQLKQKGRNFTCQGCPTRTQELRRCREDRWDFTSEDGNQFPIRIHEGGGLHGFCPGKATRDPEASSLFELLTVACEMKALLVSGGIADQPGWFIAQMAWFGPDYSRQLFVSRARMVLGDDSKGKVGTKPGGPSKGRQ